MRSRQYRYHLLRRWRAFLLAARRHEGHHREIMIGTVEEMRRGLEALGGRRTRTRMALAVTGVCQGAMRRCGARHTEYDATTRYGATEGVCFFAWL